MPVCSGLICKYFATPWAVARQAPPSLGFTRQECWSGLPFPTRGDLPDSGIEPESPALAGEFFPLGPPGKPVSSLPPFPRSLPVACCLSLSLPMSSHSGCPLLVSPLSPSLLFLFLGPSSPSFPSPLPSSLCPPPHTLASSTPSLRPVALWLSAGTISCLPGLQSQLGQEQLASRWVRLSRCPD